MKKIVALSIIVLSCLMPTFTNAAHASKNTCTNCHVTTEKVVTFGSADEATTWLKKNPNITITARLSSNALWSGQSIIVITIFYK